MPVYHWRSGLLAPQQQASTCVDVSPRPASVCALGSWLSARWQLCQRKIHSLTDGVTTELSQLPITDATGNAALVPGKPRHD